MRWFSVPVVFSIEAPTPEAACLLVEQQQANELVELLDYPEISIAALREDDDEESDSRFERHLIAVQLTFEAETAMAAVARDALPRCVPSRSGVWWLVPRSTQT